MSDRQRIWLSLSALAVALLLLCFAVVAPPLVDDARLDRAVKAVALDWRDFGRVKAEERLRYELDLQGLRGKVQDESCQMEEAEGLRSVRCAWDAELRVPLIGVGMTVPFESAASIAADGSLQ